MDPERTAELAALEALGALDGVDAAELLRRARAGDPGLEQEIAGFRETALALALAQTAPQPPRPELKQRILETLAKRPPSAHSELIPTAAAAESMVLVRSDDAGWRPLKVPGAFIRLLYFERERGYAVVLGRLDPNTHYPAHAHPGPESLYMLSGDLHIGDVVLHPGDYHRAGPGTVHGINWSEAGCTLLAVVSAENLAALGIDVPLAPK